MLCRRVILVTSVLLSFGVHKAAPETEADDIERLLWDAASGDVMGLTAVRAGQALARLWQDDSVALCHLTAALAGHGHPEDAAAACHRALRAGPTESCAIFCSLHFALWSCDFDTLDALRPRVTTSVSKSVRGGPEGVPASIGHLEALIVLPEPLLVRHLLQQARFIRAAPGQMTSFRADDKYWHMTPWRHLSLAIMTSTARQHPHGYALLAALRGIRQQNGVQVACFDTAEVRSDNNRDDVTIQIQQLCDIWIGCRGQSAVQVAASINARGLLATVDIDGWTSPNGGSLHVAALMYRPSMVSVGAVGVVSPSYAADAHDFLLTDAVSSPPEFMAATHVWRGDAIARMLTFGHPARGGLTSFVSAHSGDANNPGSPPPFIAGPSSPARAVHAQDEMRSNDWPAGRRTRRAAAGLPEDAFLLGCFHAEYKISRQLVALAARLLVASARAVLWLGFLSAAARRRVTAELQRNGVRQAESKVIVMPGYIQASQHLQIKAEVDLALDSPTYNGHSSSADLLWAATPTVLRLLLLAIILGKQHLCDVSCWGRVVRALSNGLAVSIASLPFFSFSLLTLLDAAQLTAAGHTQINRLAASILLSGPHCADEGVEGGLGLKGSLECRGSGPGGGWVATTIGRDGEDVTEIATRLMTNQHRLAQLRRKLAALRYGWGPFRAGDWASRLVRGIRMAADASPSGDAASVAHQDVPLVDAPDVERGAGVSYHVLVVS